jgi:RNA polymerase sigma factor (sigma-70 family)
MNEPQTNGTDLGLLARVTNPDDREAWQTFFDVYKSVIYRQAIRAGLTDDQAKEIAQETLIEISKRIQTFNYDRRKGSFRGWIHKLTHWRITNLFRKSRRSSGPLEYLVPDSDEPSHHPDENALLVDESEKTAEQEWKQIIFETALDTLRRKLPPEQAHVLELIAVKQRGIAQVADALQINPARVSVMKFRLISALKQEVARLQKQRL